MAPCAGGAPSPLRAYSRHDWLPSDLRFTSPVTSRLRAMMCWQKNCRLDSRKGAAGQGETGGRGGKQWVGIKILAAREGAWQGPSGEPPLRLPQRSSF